MPPKLRASRMDGMSVADISHMLVEGGYFRANIRGLPDFDKVAGGLAWGILNSRYHIDVEFVENSHIRDKIRVSEDICTALKDDMHCPHDINPHQIQGLDLPKIALVLDWLLKRVAAAREENAYFVAQYTKLDFHRRFGCPLLTAAQEEQHQVAAGGTRSWTRVAPKPAPNRVQVSSVEEEEEEHQPGGAASSSSPTMAFGNRMQQASSVLLEYGLQYSMQERTLLLQHVTAGSGVELADVLDGDAELQQDLQKMRDEEAKEQRLLDQLLAGMEVHKEKAKISTSNLSYVLASADTDKTRKVRKVYEARRAEMQAKLEEEEKEKNALEKQRAKGEQLDQESANLDEQLSAAQDGVEGFERDTGELVSAKEESIAALTDEAEQVTELERMIRADPAKAEALGEVEAAIEAKEKATRRIEQDKQAGKARIAQVKAECVEVARQVELLQSEEGQEQFEAEMKHLTTQLADLSVVLSKKEQETMAVMRLIDGFPTRAELQQYELRISELDEEIAWKFEETRLAFTMYNTKAEVAKTLTNEEAVLTQFGELFDTCIAKSAKKVAEERADLLRNAESIVAQLAASCEGQKGKLETERDTVRDHLKTIGELQDRQKRYSELLAEFRAAVEENAALQAAVEAAAGGAGADDDDDEEEEQEEEENQ